MVTNLILIDIKEILGDDIKKDFIKNKKSFYRESKDIPKFLLDKYFYDNMENYYNKIKEYLSNIISNKEFLKCLNEELLTYVENENNFAYNFINDNYFLNEYLTIDININKVIYKYSKLKTYIDMDYFEDNGCEILNAENLVNFIHYKNVCINNKKQVMWCKDFNDFYKFNHNVIPALHTRKGKINLLMNGK